MKMQNRITNVEAGTSALPFGKPMLADAVFKPMLFSTSMVQAILNDKKQQTRRIIKFPKGWIAEDNAWDWVALNEYYPNWKCPLESGNIIWGRETFAVKEHRVFYKADNNSFENAGLQGLYDFVWKPSLFMPKNICRLFLEVENVRVERLQDISEEDAIAEGLETSIVKSKIFRTYLGYKNYFIQDAEDEPFFKCPIESYKSLWMSINGSESWQENPFVWVYTFKVVECPYGFR